MDMMLRRMQRQAKSELVRVTQHAQKEMDEKVESNEMWY